MSTWVPSGRGGDPSPRRLSESLDRVARSIEAPSAGVLALVFSRWEEVVGASVAGHARPRSLSSGTLVVEVDDGAWATQLRFLADDLLSRLTEAAGGPVAERLEVRVAGEGKARRRAPRR